MPRPHGYFDGVLIMELVTDTDGNPAPRLGEVELSAATAREYHGFLIRQVVRMPCIGLIHGDLSEFNVLVAPDGPVIIDLPQAVNAAGNNAEVADDHGVRVGRKRVARLMRENGIRGATLRKYVVTTQSDPAAAKPIDLVERRFFADAPDRLWVADMTYVPTWSGWLYLAMVLDVCSRKIIGWSMGTNMRTELILEALQMAITQRRPSGVIHHSDTGSQYTSYAFGKRCQEAGIMPSMGSVGDACDNAMAESFFATLEREVLNRRRFKSQAEAKMAIFEWIEGWYNPHRRHSGLGYRSPAHYERTHHQARGRMEKLLSSSAADLPWGKIIEAA